MSFLPPDAPSLWFWVAIARLGEAQILIPAMCAAAIWLAARSDAPGAARRWVLAVALAGLVTTATKVAFMGWGIGWAPWNFVGISGHAVFSAAILPVLARVLAGSARPALQHTATAAGVGLAAAIALSRVLTHAHSTSEAASGFLLGSAAAWVALRGLQVPHTAGSRWVVAGLAVWLLVTPASAPPSRTHDWVTALALQLSGRERPYTRWMMLRAYRQELRARGEPLPPPYGRRGPNAQAARAGASGTASAASTPAPP